MTYLYWESERPNTRSLHALTGMTAEDVLHTLLNIVCVFEYEDYKVRTTRQHET